jgi:hypothetical protein
MYLPQCICSGVIDISFTTDNNVVDHTLNMIEMVTVLKECLNKAKSNSHNHHHNSKHLAVRTAPPDLRCTFTNLKQLKLL